MEDNFTDKELIGYMDLHSRTERALFHRDHINRLLALAGREPNEVFEWRRWSYYYMKPTLDLARANLSAGKHMPVCFRSRPGAQAQAENGCCDCPVKEFCLQAEGGPNAQTD